MDAIYQFIVFPITDKAINYKASQGCAYCRDFPITINKNRPILLLACVHCIHFSCFTNNHIKDHVRRHPDHPISISIDQGELYCSVCRDFVYSEQVEGSYKNALSQYRKRFGQSERPWRPSYKDFEIFPYVKPVCMPSSSSLCRQTRGLVNLGNTCFLNVVVQALTHTPVLRDFLLSDLHRCDNPMRSRNCLACEMIRITQEIYRPVLTPYVPSNLLYVIWLHATHLAGYEQRDAHEILIALLTLIHSHLVGEQAPIEDDAEDTLQLRGGGSSTASSTKRRWHDGEKLSRNGGSRCDSPGCLSNSSAQEKKGKYSPSSITSSVTGEMDERSIPTSPISTASDRTEIVENNNNNNRSTTGHPTPSDVNCNCIVHQVFFGDLESVISYQGCDHRSSTVDPFLDLSLDVAQRGSTSLAACLSSYFRPEVIDGTLPCSQCNVNRRAVKQFYLLNLPNILIFYLKRCHQDTKINTSINFPVELDLTPFVTQLAERKFTWQDRYSLYAVLNHCGQTNSGHYTAFIRSEPGSWCQCDDQKIVPVDLDRVLNTDAYVLLYHKNLLSVEPNSPSSSALSP
ncbi:hypothetical protein Aperf_G00000110976 [Anoplocephala perfoliata]